MNAEKGIRDVYARSILASEDQPRLGLRLRAWNIRHGFVGTYLLWAVVGLTVLAIVL